MSEHDDIQELEHESEHAVIDIQVPTDFKSLIEVDSSKLIAHVMAIDGVKDFNEEFMMWQEYLSRLEPYEDSVIREKLINLDLTNIMPKGKDVYEAYYRMVELQRYLYELQKPVANRVEMLKDAAKSLKASARNIFRGTDKDKEANSDRMIRNFTAELSQAKVLLNSISSSIEVIEFAAMQASRLIKEKEFELKVNGTYFGQGQSNNYQRMQEDDDDDDNPVPARFRKKAL